MIGVISKVLISDDEESRAAIGRMLKCEHLAPMVAAGAQTGLEQAFNARADLLLPDMSLAGTANMELFGNYACHGSEHPSWSSAGLKRKRRKYCSSRCDRMIAS